jgi:hypothetical protein
MAGEALEGILDRLRAFDPSPLVPAGIRDPRLDDLIAKLEASAALRSALHLWNDSLDRCHSLAQDIHDATGSYLHGVMHRREPDYANAKYWFRRVGTHPVFGKLAPDWDPFDMVDRCEKAARDPGLEAGLRELQAREIRLLAEFCLGA